MLRGPLVHQAMKVLRDLSVHLDQLGLLDPQGQLGLLDPQSWPPQGQLDLLDLLLDQLDVKHERFLNMFSTKKFEIW